MKMIYLSEGNIPSKAANGMQVMKMSQALARQVADFSLVTLGDANETPFDYWTWYGILHPFTIVRLPLLETAHFPFASGYRHPDFPPEALRYAMAQAPDLVFTRSPQMARTLLSTDLPFFFECHEPPDEIALLADERRWATCDNFLGWITIHENLVGRGARIGIPPERILVLPDAVDLERFTPQLTKKVAREKIGRQSARPIALYSGHLYEHRGVETILACASSLPEVDFIFIGGWEHDIERRRQEAQTMNLTNVAFLGFVENLFVPHYLFAADILLMPHSRMEPRIGWTSPMKMFEYLASGRPLLAADHPVFNDILLHQQNAWLAPPDDPSALAKAIRELLNHPDTADRIGLTGRREAEQQTWDRRVEKILQYAGKFAHV